MGDPYSVENIDRLGVLMFQTSDNSQLLRRVYFQQRKSPEFWTTKWSKEGTSFHSFVFLSTAAALFCFTTLLNDNRRTKGAKSLSLHSRSKEKIIALKLAPKKCTLLSQKSERKNANCCCLVGSFCSFEVRLNLYLLSLWELE